MDDPAPPPPPPPKKKKKKRVVICTVFRNLRSKMDEAIRKWKDVFDGYMKALVTERVLRK